MAGMKEIRTHIKSVQQTLKITNAMYLIASSNLRKARKKLAEVEPYFRKIGSTITDILYHSPEVEHAFFDQRPELPPERRKTGFVVITGDKGLAGAYNHSILKLAEEQLAHAHNPVLFLVGQVGRAYFARRGMTAPDSNQRPKGDFSICKETKEPSCRSWAPWWTWPLTTPPCPASRRPWRWS